MTKSSPKASGSKGRGDEDVLHDDPVAVTGRRGAGDEGTREPRTIVRLSVGGVLLLITAIASWRGRIDARQSSAASALVLVSWADGAALLK